MRHHREGRRARVWGVILFALMGTVGCAPFGPLNQDAAAGADGNVAGAGGAAATPVDAADAHGGALGSGGGGAVDGGPTDSGGPPIPKDGGSSTDTDGGASPDGGPGAVPCVASQTPLRLISPLSTSFVTSRRPTLTWEGEASCGTTIDLCSDPACATVVATVSAGAGATSSRPSTDLPSGVIFWRAHSGPAATGIWSFFVGKGTPVDSSGGTFSDFNGDGRSDVAVEADNGVVLVYYGAPGGLNPTPTTLQIPDPARFAAGGDMASVGDISGDGLADLVIASWPTSYDASFEIYVFLGKSTGVDPLPSQTVPVESFIQIDKTAPDLTVRGGLDVDGDGYGDFLMLWATGDATPLHGGPVGVLQAKAISLLHDFGDVSSGVGAICDVDGDGIQDFVTLVGSASAGPAPVVFKGTGSTFVRVNPTIAARAGTEAFSTVICADVQGDGYPEIILGAPYSSARGDSLGDVVVFSNTKGTLSSTGHSVAGQDVSGQAYSGSKLKMVGDMDADGIDDFAIGLGGETDVAQVAFNGLSSTATDTVEIGGTPDIEGAFGRALAGGDFDGDGLADLIVTSPLDGGGRLTLFKGSRAARIVAPSSVHVDAPVGVTGLGQRLSASR